MILCFNGHSKGQAWCLWSFNPGEAFVTACQGTQLAAAPAAFPAPLPQAGPTEASERNPTGSLWQLDDEVWICGTYSEKKQQSP